MRIQKLSNRMSIQLILICKWLGPQHILLRYLTANHKIKVKKFKSN